MRDFGVSVLDQYEINVTETHRVRGGLVVTAREGTYILKEQLILPERIRFLVYIYQLLEECETFCVDTPIANKEGEYLSKAEDGTTYMLKKWFEWQECDIRKEEEIIKGAKTLAQIHKHLKIQDEVEIQIPNNQRTLLDEYERHNRELRKVYNFVRKRSVKNAFEAEFLKGYEKMYVQAQHALDKMREERYIEVCKSAEQNHEVSHGDYNYHNILFGNQDICITGFEHAHIEAQVSDLYYYLRKILEKYHYEERIGNILLDAYEKVKPLTKSERDYLAIRLSYPEKFWKITNAYYHSNKAWIPGKNVEKLKMSIEQSEEKKRMLERLFSICF